MGSVRHPAVAGLFYPRDADELTATVRSHLLAAVPPPGRPKAIVAPHAGYVYSGAVAGFAYAHLESVKNGISRVVLLGPSHRVAFRGLALSRADAFTTPFGEVAVDVARRDEILDLPQVAYLDEAHAEEHSVEVQLPFLQHVLGIFRVLPLVVGDATADDVGEVLERVWGGPETLVVLSTDLSHYHDYDTAVRLDRETTRAIEALRPDIRPEQACGSRPLNGLLMAAARRSMRVTTLVLRNSGDTAGPRDRVVGYGAYALA